MAENALRWDKNEREGVWRCKADGAEVSLDGDAYVCPECGGRTTARRVLLEDRQDELQPVGHTPPHLMGRRDRSSAA